MTIDCTTYSLKEKNYNPIKTKKNKIIIGHTSSNMMNHVTGWNKRLNGKYKKTSHFTISIEGDAYKHFDLDFYSDLMDDEKINKDSIFILIENEGWLESAKNRFINYFGDIYNRSDSVFRKTWRNKKYWAPYNEKQIDTCVKLVSNICEDLGIKRKVIEHNTLIDNIYTCEGIYYKSNFERYYTDISPAWDFKNFKEIIETKNK
jgi:N-acetyl-anhydromuramyl-L-alanine amidase AmpD